MFLPVSKSSLELKSFSANQKQPLATLLACVFVTLKREEAEVKTLKYITVVSEAEIFIMFLYFK